MYKGVRSPLYTTPITTSVSFAAYEAASRMLGIKPGEKRTIPAGIFCLGWIPVLKITFIAALSGTWAGFVFATVVTPIELLKTRLQVNSLMEFNKITSQLRWKELEIIARALDFQLCSKISSKLKASQ